MSLPASDSFAGIAEAQTLQAYSGNWANRSSNNLVGATGGGAVSPVGGDSIYQWTADVFSADQWAECVYTPSGGTSCFIGPAVRVDSGGAGWGLILPDSAAYTMYLNLYSSGAYGGESYSATGPASGATVRLSAEDVSGTTRLRIYFDDVLVLTQDVSTGPDAGSAGLAAFGGGGVKATNWAAGNLGGGQPVDGRIRNAWI